ncbi:glycoside hydrolase family 35 protein [Agromyces cerinus]|uniref:Beta-galactosidase n=1 Tax=Agromyces cerinus subsp. cerinus TaxID=232089 RepID=A0A1N6H955_9MICO|nr:beta-galactosidase [Agromyces cerinus]SIO16302.1 beta-galactosidase [Agromyces cerinus subsp. cerinus]
MTRPAPSTITAPILAFRDGELLRDGAPHRVLSGSVHYFRVHPELWRDRLERLAALGLNTVDTYIAWNFHQRRPGDADFSGWRDVERFIALAGELGFDVIVRPGPYICAEWDNGGLPSWLTGVPGLRPRSSDDRYMTAVEEWFDELIPRLAALQASRGGPVVAVQLENEFGSYGDDAAYLRRLRDALVDRGITELLYTADGPTELMLDGGTVPGVLATATFGSRAREAFELLRSRRDGEPFLCAEYWNGWFDHWGERHHVREPGGSVGVIDEILEVGGSVSIYMAHGGTNFGLWSGANHDGRVLQPTVTSYDSDAPVSEHGAITEKGRMLRQRLEAFTGVVPPAIPEERPVLAARRLPTAVGAALLPALRAAGGHEASAAVAPASFEELGLDAGLVLYEAMPILPRGTSTISMRGLHDRAQVWVDGRFVGVVDTASAQAGLEVTGHGERARLEVLVENQGRINYGPLLGQGKGILGVVQVDRRIVQGWRSRPIALDEWSRSELEAATAPTIAGSDADGVEPVEPGAAGFFTATFEVESAADTFLALPGFAKGFVWVNGFLLGRYWEIGPQVTLYVPSPLLRAGVNTVIVLELERSGEVLELREAPELGPEEEYIESFD